MADVAAMDIVIGADVSKAIQGLEGLSTELADLSKTGVTSVNQLSRAMDTLRAAAAKTTDVGTLAKYNQALEKLSGEATRLKNVGLGEGLKKIRPGASEATQSLTDLGRVAQDLPFGFIAIQNNLGPLFESFGRLAAESKKTGTSLLSNLGAALSGPAGIGVALSVVSAAITLFQLGFSAWTRGFGAGKKAVDDATKANEDFTKSLNDARAGAISTGMQLQNFINIARDGSKPLEQRNEALNEANRLMGEHGKKLTLANVGTKAITDQTNLFTEALINQAVATKYADRAADLIIKQTEASREYAKALDDSNKKTKDANELNRIAGTGTGGIGGGGNIVATNNATTALNKLVGAATNYKLITKDLNQVDTDLAATQEKVTASLGKIGEKTKETAKHTKDTADVIKELTKSLKDFNTEQQGIGGDFRDNMIKAIDSAVTELIKLGVAADDPRIQNLLKIAKGITQTMNDAAAAIQTTREKVDPEKLKSVVPQTLGKRLATAIGPVPLQVDIDIKALKAKVAAQKIAEEFNKEFAKILESGLEDIAGAFAEGLGNLFSGKSNAFAGIFDAIAGIMEQLGKMLIGVGIGVEAIKTSLKTLNPIVAVAAGIALIALAQVAKNFTQGLAMAEGGIVTGPTRALIGEAGPEVVFPLDRLREFIQPAQAQRIIVEGRLRGEDIWFSNARTQHRRNRTY